MNTNLEWQGAVPWRITNYNESAAVQYQTDATDDKELRLNQWLSRQLKQSGAARTAGRSRKLEQLSLKWPDTNEVFVFGKNRIKHGTRLANKKTFVRSKTD